MLSLLRLECQQKDFWKSTLNLLITLFSYLELKWQIRSCIPSKTIQSKMAQKPYPLGQHIPIKAYIREHPPCLQDFSFLQYFFIFKCTGYRLGDTEGGGSQPLPETVSSRNSGIQQENVRGNILLLFLVEFWKIILKRVSLTDSKF